MQISTVNISDVDRYRTNITIAQNIMSHVHLRLVYLELTFTYSNDNLVRRTVSRQTFCHSC